MHRIFVAPMDDGKLLPVVDITNPAFAVNVSSSELERRAAEFLSRQARSEELTEAQRAALAASTFGRALMPAAGTYLPGLITYRMKLDPIASTSRPPKSIASLSTPSPLFARAFGSKTSRAFSPTVWSPRWPRRLIVPSASSPLPAARAPIAGTRCCCCAATIQPFLPPAGFRQVATRPRSQAQFATLALAAGWRVDRMAERPLTLHLRLVRA